MNGVRRFFTDLREWFEDVRKLAEDKITWENFWYVVDESSKVIRGWYERVWAWIDRKYSEFVDYCCDLYEYFFSTLPESVMTWFKDQIEKGGEIIDYHMKQCRSTWDNFIEFVEYVTSSECWNDLWTAFLDSHRIRQCIFFYECGTSSEWWNRQWMDFLDSHWIRQCKIFFACATSSEWWNKKWTEFLDSHWIRQCKFFFACVTSSEFWGESWDSFIETFRSYLTATRQQCEIFCAHVSEKIQDARECVAEFYAKISSAEWWQDRWSDFCESFSRRWNILSEIWEDFLEISDRGYEWIVRRMTYDWWKEKLVGCQKEA
jgi:hypothetical protein